MEKAGEEKAESSSGQGGSETGEDKRAAEILGKGEKKGFFSRNFYLLADFWSFMRVRKKWWLLPIIITLVLVGLLIVFGQSSPLSPFIYALF